MTEVVEGLQETLRVHAAWEAAQKAWLEQKDKYQEIERKLSKDLEELVKILAAKHLKVTLVHFGNQSPEFELSLRLSMEGLDGPERAERKQVQSGPEREKQHGGTPEDKTAIPPSCHVCQTNQEVSKANATKTEEKSSEPLYIVQVKNNRKRHNKNKNKNRKNW
uniref:Uncharacterized protein n=1 Tax=Knipowitschia caucasica TaxID=637954 RepID=A0AAV2IWV3_KNICA